MTKIKENSTCLTTEEKKNSINEEQLYDEFKYFLDAVEARYASCAPKDDLNGLPIVFNTLECKDIFWTIAEEVDYSSIYQHINLYKVGDTLQSENPNINITLKAKVMGCDASSNFDNDGIIMSEKQIMKDSKYVAEYGMNRFAQYLGKEITGDFPVICVEKGDMKPSGDYIEIISMSGLQIDLYNDYIGGEVRLAYLYKDGKKTPLTQFSVSASFKEAIASAKLSSETSTRSSYFGPKQVMMKNFKIY